MTCGAVDKLAVKIDLVGDECRKFAAIRRSLGISANSEVMRHLITKEYDDLADKGLLKPRFGHSNTLQDHTKIIDYDRRDIVFVYFKDGTAWCELDETTHCEHTDFALTVPEVREAFKARGWKIRER